MTARAEGAIADAPAFAELVLRGPRPPADPARLPLRGDLAHVRLAGRCFVPHYAVPIACVVREGAVLRAAPRDTAEAITDVATGQVFDVLEIAGSDSATGWAWGQIVQRDDQGLVGYLPMRDLDRP